MIWALVVIVMTNHPGTDGCSTIPLDGGRSMPIMCPAFVTSDLQKPVKLFRTEDDCNKALGSASWIGWAQAACIPIDLTQLGK